MSIETNKNRVILWCTMTHRAACKTTLEFESKDYGQLMKRLGASASMHGQEIILEVTDDGWIVEINACEETGKARILIPKDREKPVKILEDTRKESEAHEQAWEAYASPCCKAEMSQDGNRWRCNQCKTLY